VKLQWNCALAICELLAILLITGAMFMWGRGAALDERGCEACGGEYLLLALPVFYYVGKRTILSWSADIRKLWKKVNN